LLSLFSHSPFPGRGEILTFSTLAIGKPLAPGLQGFKLFSSRDISNQMQRFAFAIAFKKAWLPGLLPYSTSQKE
jgi:hypothetical protein